jgi:hypothetical protein
MIREKPEGTRRKICPPCQSVRNKSSMDKLGIEPGAPRWEAGDWSSTVLYKKISSYLQENTVSAKRGRKINIVDEYNRCLSHELHETKVHCASRSQWPGGLTGRSTAARLLRPRVRIPPWKWMSISCECCELSGWGLCDKPITRPEEFYHVWCIWVWWWSLDDEEALADCRLYHEKRKYRVRAKLADGALGSAMFDN